MKIRQAYDLMKFNMMDNEISVLSFASFIKPVLNVSASVLGAEFSEVNKRISYLFSRGLKETRNTKI